MDITVHQTGGVFGIDRKVEVGSGHVTVSHDGERQSRALPSVDHDALQEAAASVLRRTPRIRRREGYPVADSMTTEVVVADEDGHVRSVRFGSGDGVPRTLRELVNTVVELAG